MNEREQVILDLIRNNPYITQLDLAERLNLSRSAIAGYISTLTKAGHIIGRAYVLNESRKVLCIGGANIDRKAKLVQDFQWQDSNPVHVSDSAGGVARNIAENLSKLLIPTSLLTVIGNDQASEVIWESSSLIDRSPSIEKQGQRTGTYTAVLNNDNEMVFALADMDIYDSVSTEDLNLASSHLRAAEMLILDTNFPKNVLREIIQNKQKDQVLALVPVSSKKMNRVPDSLEQIDFIIFNEEELKSASKRYLIDSSLDTIEQMDEILKLGVKNVIVTNGKNGVTFKTEMGEHGSLAALPVSVKDVTGAGDAFAAGVIYGLYHELPLREACKYGIQLAKFTIETDESVAKNLNETFFMDKDPLEQGGE
ncbi:carbohydrate kinase [Salipaludibacillus sp. HK11]|uniref:carbohydrate kinase n=1 Tax=Salipaludibacillus sp. HK11 TaxID=3394320 RepID=UPI0039FC6A92